MPDRISKQNNNNKTQRKSMLMYRGVGSWRGERYDGKEG